MSTSAEFPVTTNGGAEYGDCQTATEFICVEGLLVVPRCKTGSQPKIVTIHDPYTIREVKFNATRRTRPPIIPAPETLTGSTFLGGSVTIPLPQINTQEGTYNWAVGGGYRFIEASYLTLGASSLPTAGYPYALGAIDYSAAQAAQDAGADPNAGVQSFLDTTAEIVDNDTLYSWPFTHLPPACVQPLLT